MHDVDAGLYLSRGFMVHGVRTDGDDMLKDAFLSTRTLDDGCARGWVTRLARSVL